LLRKKQRKKEDYETNERKITRPAPSHPTKFVKLKSNLNLLSCCLKFIVLTECVRVLMKLGGKCFSVVLNELFNVQSDYKIGVQELF